jgi:molecular chaperone GrpE
VTSEPNSVDDLENAVDQSANGEVNGMPAETSAGEAASESGAAGPGNPDAHDAAPGDSAPPEPAEPAPPEPGPGADGLLAQVASATQEIAAATDRYHARAEQREGVIDYLRSELDLLRRGERRGLLRPVLTELCRLRDDLLKQAATLPADFTADKAADLLRSYAETIELTLENNGVVTYVPDSGDPFNPRLHRRISGAPTADPALTGHVAGIQRDGYLDIEANSPISPAEVSVYAVGQGEQKQ